MSTQHIRFPDYFLYLEFQIFINFLHSFLFSFSLSVCVCLNASECVPFIIRIKSSKIISTTLNLNLFLYNTGKKKDHFKFEFMENKIVFSNKIKFNKMCIS